MAFISSLPTWMMALGIFTLRIVDVSLGTLRTIAVVHGWIRLSVLVGFFEVLVWVAAVSQVMARVTQQPALLFAYAAGFAAGNAVGIALERRLALGTSEVRMISMHKGREIAASLRSIGQALTTFDGQGREGPHTLVYVTCPRKELLTLIKTAKAIDPDMFYVVDAVAQSSQVSPLPHPSGWRALLKKK